MKATQRELKNSFKYIISINYCDLQHLLKYNSPEYYTAGSSLNNAYKYFADNGYIIKSKLDGWFITEKLLKMNNNNEVIF